MLSLEGCKAQRLVFYNMASYEQQELDMIRDFKLWCVEQDFAVPENDQEIMRALVANKYDNQRAYNFVCEKYNF